ncbi:hypothetical protein L195_g050873 [Trifolium pratense]|uniref:Uncharacterized protein n=1 Tax=Trifolium pratense TaxID=57577 RepID=A0A2K3JWH0_TRIPR|nr:hypothetical protein L195_g050873 [Trifolium pratense]
MIGGGGEAYEEPKRGVESELVEEESEQMVVGIQSGWWMGGRGGECTGGGGEQGFKLRTASLDAAAILRMR